ncbi:hypothetical protein [Halomicrobium salinisoli]|uniref:hypothetical protein n=1 Tax=Halomicrobium salinisoli TaxID=2878391 RepID=UPI001CF04C94|nr:hypothetical protein [Halomicrobium salinisoli]
MRYLAADMDDGPADVAFENADGEVSISTQHGRFSERYAKERYGRLKELDRTVMSEYTDPHTVMLTLGGSVRNAAGGYRAPVDHAKDLTESKGAVRKAVHRACGDKPHEIATVFGYHENGYLHCHIGVYVDGPVSKADFKPVIDAHVNNSPIAKGSHHPYSEAISVHSHRNKGRSDGEYTSGLATYLGGNILGIDGDVDGQDRDAPLQAAVTVKASGINMISLPRGWKNRLGVADDESDDGEWEYAGIVVDDNVIDVDGDSGGSSTEWVTPRELPDSVDPTDHLSDSEGGVG